MGANLLSGAAGPTRVPHTGLPHGSPTRGGGGQPPAPASHSFLPDQACWSEVGTRSSHFWKRNRTSGVCGGGGRNPRTGSLPWPGLSWRGGQCTERRRTLVALGSPSPASSGYSPAHLGRCWPSFPRAPEPRAWVLTEKMLRTAQPCGFNNELLIVDPPLCWPGHLPGTLRPSPVAPLPL